MREDVSIFKKSPEPGDPKRVLIVAGEASGDLHGSNLVKAMKDAEPGIVFRGIGGREMARAGVDILFSSSDLAVVGLTEVVSKFRAVVRASRTVKSAITETRPHLLILIDYPDFNLHIAATANRSGVPVMYYISPQVWAWRRGRIGKISKRVDRMVVILPFEEHFYKERGVKVDYVGHPLLDAHPQGQRGGRARGRIPFAPGDPLLGLVPGSREQEVRNLLPAMIGAVEILRETYPRMRCVLPLAPGLDPALVRDLTASSRVDIRISEEGLFHGLKDCRAAMVASGTATLETALMGLPMVIVYRISPVSYWVGKRVVKVPFIGLVNLVAQRKVVPELIQGEVTARRLAVETAVLLEDTPARHAMVEGLVEISGRLGKGGASERAARIALEMMMR